MAGAEKIGEFGIWYVVFLLTLTLHEAGHALVAWLGGDDTAYRGGQVSLSPWPHIRREPIGTLIVPIVTYLTNGWMMGWASTPYDPLWGQRHPRRQAAMAAAGPAANLLIALVVFGTLKLLLGVGLFVAPDHADFNQVVSPSPGAAPGSWAWPAAFCLSVALNLNVLLFLFNLIPLPPLDGAGILHGLLPGSLGGPFGALARNPGLSLAGLLVAWRLFDLVYPGAFSLLLALLHPGITYR